MDVTVRRPKRLGMLIPSSVTSHVSRIGVVTLSAEADSLGQFETDQFVAASALLRDAAVDLILWNGTAASWLGFEWDARIMAAIEHRTGVRATTAVMAINRRLARLSAKRIGLVTPYVAALEERIVANYARIGIETVAAERLDLTVNTDFADVSPKRIATMVRDVAKARPDAVVVMCTNLAGASLAEPLGLELGISILDSVRVAIEHSCGLLDPVGP